MTNTQKISSRTLTQSDIELIERIIYKTSDDVVVSIARSLERLEERIDATESRLDAKLNDLLDEVAKAKSPTSVTNSTKLP